MNRIGTNPATCIPSTVALGGAALTSPCWTVHIEATLSEGGRKTGTIHLMSRVERWASVPPSRTSAARRGQRPPGRVPRPAPGLAADTVEVEVEVGRALHPIRVGDAAVIFHPWVGGGLRGEVAPGGPPTLGREPRSASRTGQGSGEDFRRLRAALADRPFFTWAAAAQ
jgi:hypothetical protein